MNPFLLFGALNGFLAVAFGAFGTHVLGGRIDPSLLEIWQTGVRYQMFHAVGLAIVGILEDGSNPTRWLRLSGWMMLIGILLFSGSLYLLVATGIRKLGIVAPFGGFAFLFGWLFFMIHATRKREQWRIR
jgi:Protein of unknown function (DUF423).